MADTKKKDQRKNIQFDISWEEWRLLKTHPDYPGPRGGQVTFYRHTFLEALWNPEQLLIRQLERLRRKIKAKK
jgi:hypothetical protein